jgi:hypothetical protein
MTLIIDQLGAGEWISAEAPAHTPLFVRPDALSDRLFEAAKWSYCRPLDLSHAAERWIIQSKTFRISDGAMTRFRNAAFIPTCCVFAVRNCLPTTIFTPCWKP